MSKVKGFGKKIISYVLCFTGSDVENSTELSSEETGDEGESDESKKVVDIKNSSDISSDSSNVESDSMV